MTVTLDPNGWTDVAPSGDGRLVHVSALGSDMNAGSTPRTPMRTVTEALKNVRQGHGDHLCLKSGDTWSEPLGKWIWSGESAQNPVVVRTYGGLERAHLLTSATTTALHFEGGGGAPPKFEHAAFIGIDFKAVGRDGAAEANGVNFLRPVNNVLFEDCRWAGYGNGLILYGFDGSLMNVRLRRCVVLDSWGSLGNVQGLYAAGISGLSLFECVFDHNGWNPDIFRHGIYCQNGGGPTTIEGCVISQSSSHGLQLRSGGRVTGNLFLRNPIGLSLGGGDQPDPLGVGVTVRGNLVLEGRDIDAANPRGWGMQASNIRKGSIEGNVIAHNGGMQPSGLRLEGEVGIGIHDLRVDDNVIDGWGAGLEPSGDLAGVSYSGNHFEDAAAVYFSPSRGVPSYLNTIGWNPSTDEFIQAARGQSKANWNRKLVPTSGLIRHVKAGFVTVP